MPDQAQTLREGPSEQQGDQPPVKVLSFTSGKGGVGKTNVVVNLGYALAEMGKRVMLLDADLGLANIDVLLGLSPRNTIQHVLSGERSLREIILDGPAGMRILPAASGVQELVDLNEAQKLLLLSEFDLLGEKIDVLLIDTGAGISRNVTYFNTAAQNIVVVTAPEPTAITDAYALIKVLSQKYRVPSFKVLVNIVENEGEGKDVFRKLSAACDRFLDVSLDYLGYIMVDENLPQAVRQQRVLQELIPRSRASRCVRKVAKRVLEMRGSDFLPGGVQFFWRQLLQGTHR